MQILFIKNDQKMQKYKQNAMKRPINKSNIF